MWRLQDGDDATAFRPLGQNVLVNLSVWADVAALSQYVYRSAHVEIMRRRREWFDRLKVAHMVLWWVPVGHRPTVEEAVAVTVAVRDPVELRLPVRVRVLERVTRALGVCVEESEKVAVPVELGLPVPVCVTERVGEGVPVKDAVTVAVEVEVEVGVDVNELLELAVTVLESLELPEGVPDPVTAAVPDLVTVSIAVLEGVPVLN